METKKVNQAGIALIKKFESCRLTAYQDVVGIWTIGWGHVSDDIEEGQEITQDEADQLLREDLDEFEDGVSQLVKVELTDNQFAALVAFSYNVGLNNLKQSMLLRCLNMHNAKDAADQFLRWDHAGGKVVAGLTRRREAERELFLTE
jgi:lysozyme